MLLFVLKLSGVYLWVITTVFSPAMSLLSEDRMTLGHSIVVNTWNFTQATQAGWGVLESGGFALDSVESGCTKAEEIGIPTVGFGGSPDEKGNTTLDAMIMDGNTMQVGAVASMHRVKTAIKVARAVLSYTTHTLLVGQAATDFAAEMEFPLETLETPHSRQLWQNWQDNRCQPNFRRNVFPDPTKSCGPYKPALPANKAIIGPGLRSPGTVDEDHHDTIGMLALDIHGNMAVGTSTNGASHRVPGRVGDTAIPGSGGYADSRVGAAAGTGDGDILMRFLLSYQAVELMRSGLSPTQACEQSLRRVRQVGPWSGALVALNNRGEYGGACVGFTDYSISVKHSGMADKPPLVLPIKCFNVTS